MGLRLSSYPHYHLTGSNRYRLRVGDYRVIYTFDAAKGVIHLLAVGHRREILQIGLVIWRGNTRSAIHQRPLIVS